MKALVLVLAFVCSQAMAVGVPLITPGPPLPAGVELNIKTAHPQVARVIPIVLHRDAFRANVLNVTIDGKVHTFVGHMLPQPPGHTQFEAWSGAEGKPLTPNGASIALSYGHELHSLGGRIWIGQVLTYDLLRHDGRDYLLENDPSYVTHMQTIAPFDERYPASQVPRRAQ